LQSFAFLFFILYARFSSFHKNLYLNIGELTLFISKLIVAKTERPVEMQVYFYDAKSA